MDLLEHAKRLADAAGGGWLPREAVEELAATTAGSVERLMLELIPLASRLARPAHSGFRVGAVARGDSGALFFGANLEFAGCALNQTVHAEQTAIINAGRRGETGVSHLAVSAPPCGYCRQFLWELATANRLEILLADTPSAPLSNYLPEAFGPANLGVVGGLLTRKSHSLEWVCQTGLGYVELDHAAAELARHAAETSYSPYTGAYAALSLITHNGEIFVGAYLENAAFNPSVSPIQSAVVGLMLASRSLEDVSAVVVVQLEKSPIDHTSVTRTLLSKIAPHIVVQERLVQPIPAAAKYGGPAARPASAEGDLSFYFFDFDDNVIFLTTPILLRNKITQQSQEIGTAEFASVRTLLGQYGPWKDFEQFEDTYSHFQDISAEKLQPDQRQFLEIDIEQAVSKPTETWQAPSWPLFVHACEQQRPLAIITARGHSCATIKAGLRVLVEKQLLPREPNYLAIYPVGNAEVATELIATLSVRKARCEIRHLEDKTSALKRIAIRQAVETALKVYGPEPEHRFGMSDDDPQNVDLIIKAMCDCKLKFPDKRFFVINTHRGEWVKLEVFPVDYPVTGRATTDKFLS